MEGPQRNEPEDEAFALIEGTTGLFHSVTDNFLKHTEEGCLKIRKDPQGLL